MAHLAQSAEYQSLYGRMYHGALLLWALIAHWML